MIEIQCGHYFSGKGQLVPILTLESHFLISWPISCDWSSSLYIAHNGSHISRAAWFNTCPAWGTAALREKTINAWKFIASLPPPPPPFSQRIFGPFAWCGLLLDAYSPPTMLLPIRRATCMKALGAQMLSNSYFLTRQPFSKSDLSLVSNLQSKRRRKPSMTGKADKKLCRTFVKMWFGSYFLW